MTQFIVARYSPKHGPIEPLDPSFSAHDCTLGREIGIKEHYETREEAAFDAARLQAHVDEDGCVYHAARIIRTGEE